MCGKQNRNEAMKHLTGTRQYGDRKGSQVLRQLKTKGTEGDEWGKGIANQLYPKLEQSGLRPCWRQGARYTGKPNNEAQGETCAKEPQEDHRNPTHNCFPWLFQNFVKTPIFSDFPSKGYLKIPGFREEPEIPREIRSLSLANKISSVFVPFVTNDNRMHKGKANKLFGGCSSLQVVVDKFSATRISEMCVTSWCAGPLWIM